MAVRIWRRSAALGREVVAATGGLLAALGVVLVVAIFVESLFDRTIDVQPLSVPRALSDDGLTPEVVALDLRDQMAALTARVRQERGHSDGLEIVDPEELPDVSVPSVGLSAQALAGYVRAFFKIQNRLIISGEIVSRDLAYELTLRLNGRSIFTSPKMLPRDRLDDLLAEGARRAVDATQPYVAAVLASDDRDYPSAVALCRSIIARGGSAPQIRFARLLEAQALLRLGHRDEAAKAYEDLIALDPRDVAAHVDLGDILAGLGQDDAAVAEYRKAIAVDATLAFPQDHLARVYLKEGRPEDAVREVRAGVDANPASAYWHFVLARVLRRAGRGAEATEEFRRAAALEPPQPWVRVEIGEALRAAGLLDDAVAQFEAALASDPGSTQACRGLAPALAARGRSAELPPACAAAAESASAPTPAPEQTTTPAPAAATPESSAPGR